MNYISHLDYREKAIVHSWTPMKTYLSSLAQDGYSMISTDVYGVVDGQEKVVVSQVQTTLPYILSNSNALSLY